MATEIFTGVHSFRLKYPQYSSFRNNVSSHGEWIELYKNKNELPTAKLRTWVLYYRNGGQWYGSTSPANGNYIFYDQGGGFGAGGATNNDGRQLGWIWGFPLFNVGATATNWPKWGSCLGNTHGFSGGETHGNEKMLVDISQQRNIIILDFNGYNVNAFSSNAKSTDKIKDNIDTGTNKGFYLTLRLKSSQENELKDFTTFFGTAADASPGGWATLVEYVYECDIIGPKDMLDFTLDYFLYIDDINTKLFGENLKINNIKYKLAYISDNDANSYHDNLKISIITGLGPSAENDTVSNWSNNDRLMDTDGIYDDLVYNGTTNKVLQKWIGTGTQETTNRVTVTKIIGGYYSKMGFSTPSQHIGYYGDSFGSGQFQTRIGTHGWNNNTILKNKDCDNGVTRTDSTTNPAYNLNNIIWCSLNSPRKTKVKMYGAFGKFNYRFVDNYLDLNGIECSGGGYARFPNTIDLPRNNLKPYYGSNANSNTIQKVKDFDNNVTAQYFTDDIQRTLTDIADNHFKVYYKLLIPPISGESYKIKYTFGKNYNSKVTFFRYSGMSGTATPSGLSSLNAKRDSEDIELEWTISDLDSNNDISKKHIIFLDIASGYSNHTTTPTGPKIVNTVNIEDYNLSFNVFQVQIYNLDSVKDYVNLNLDDNPYQEKTFQNIDAEQFIDISSTPLGYEPFRYINTELPYIFSTNYENDISYAPLFIGNEGLIYNYTTVIANTTGVSASDNVNLISSYLENSQRAVHIDLSANTLNNVGLKRLDGENISNIFFEKQGRKKYFDISNNMVKFKSLNNEDINFHKPFSINLGNNLIPNYWRLYKPINNYFLANLVYDDNTLIDYNYQTTISQILEITNINIRLVDNLNRTETGIVKYILLNSNENKLNISASTVEGLLVPNDIIIDVEGVKYLLQQLDEYPAIIQLKCNDVDFNPFGTNRDNFIGDITKTRSENGGVNVPVTNDPFNLESKERRNILNLPENLSARFIANVPIVEKLSKNNGLETSTDRRIWNNLYDITIRVWDDGDGGNSGYQNKTLNELDNGKGTINPTDLKILLIDIPTIEYITPVNDEGYPDNSIKLNSNNTTFELNWKGNDYLFDDVSFNTTIENGGKLGKKIEIIWTIQRQNTTTNEIVTLLNSTVDSNLSYTINNNEIIFTFIDKTVRIFDKYKYTISGVCRWIGIKELLLQDGVISQLSDEVSIPSFNITSFTTDEIFICKNNKFPYGRFNTTATNLKLYRPLLLRTVGQRDQFNNLIGGDCSIVKKTRPNVLSDGGSNNNIYMNTADNMTRKETFKRLSTLRLNR